MRTFSDSEFPAPIPLRPLRVRVARGTAAFLFWAVLGFTLGVGGLSLVHRTTTCTTHEAK